MLRCLGGDLRYLGENPAAAAAMDMALLTYELCGDLAVLHAANLCAAEGIGVDTLAGMFPAGHPSRKLAALIHAGRVDGLGATISVWNGAIERIREQAADAGINREVPDFIASFFQHAIRSGWGEEDIPALMKVLRAR
jgi:3-hydroxyisobutyrate dehydrogenase-like beta-hydroxyacid dehydrogenase